MSTGREGLAFLKRLVVERTATGVLLVLLAIILVTGIVNPRFFSGYNLQTLSRQVVIFGLLSIGETFVIVTGGIDLSLGSLTALLNVLAAWFMTHGFGVAGAVLATLAIAACFGMWHGFFVTKLKVPAFIITLGTFAAAKGLAAVITRGWPISGLPAGFSNLWEGMVAKVIPIPVVLFLLVALLAHFVLGYTVWGQHLYAVGGNLEAARRFGIRINRVRMAAYVVSALSAGVVALLIAARLNQGNPTVGTFYEMYAIAGVVIGGASLFGGEGSVIGGILGASIISVLWNALVLLRVSSYWHEVTVGAIIVVAVTVDVLRRLRGQTVP
ncbi:MAG: ABC-type transporter, integral membrane subunit [Acetothermia bacterium 64_32]|nr:MAG: ABC-type transporter, integral membrane subunit [Acetothermia bacterium 64_32]